MRIYQIPVLMYHKFHRDTECEYPYFINIGEFEEQVKYLCKNNYTTIFFSDLEKIDKKNGKKYIILTADDGYRDNYQLMFPIIKKYNIKMNIFLVSGKTYNSWDCDRVEKKYPRYELLNPEEIMEMKSSKLVEFGLHGKNHKDLSKLDETGLWEEIYKGKKELEEKYDIKISSMAYPYGKCNKKVKGMAKLSGIKYGCMIETGPKIFVGNLSIRRVDIKPNDMENFPKKVNGKYHYRVEVVKDLKRVIKRILEIFQEDVDISKILIRR